MTPGPAAQRLQAGVIDGAPRLLEQSYLLRYRVYCLERKFLPAAAYPLGLETDDFDSHSVHVGVVDSSGELLGTARLVDVPTGGPRLPLFRHCSLFAHEADLGNPANKVVEVSRLSMSRRNSRRAHNGSRRRYDDRREVFPTLLKAIYQAAKRMEATHWIAATERSLQRRVERYGFPFRAIGPEADYSGLVTPYIMSLEEFDTVILSRRIPALDEFLVGLEPQFRPRLDDTFQAAGLRAAAGEWPGLAGPVAAGL